MRPRSPRWHGALAALLAIALLSQPATPECIHDKILADLEATRKAAGLGRRLTTSPQNYSAVRQLDHSGKRILSSVYAPIRLVFDTSLLAAGADAFACTKAGDVVTETTSGQARTCAATDVLSTDKFAYIKNVLLPAVANFFTSALSVTPVQGKLVLSNPWDDAYCASTAYVCCNKYWPSVYKTTGATNADAVLVVTARPTGSTVVAWALTCQNDDSGRPIAGQVNINPSQVTTTTSTSAASMLDTVIHEVMHALGFSADLFPQFRRAGSTTLMPLSEILVETVDANLGGKSVRRIITPNVVAKAKEHFNCLSWPDAGVELEDYGGAGTAGSHWEKRILYHDVMSGFAEPLMYKTAITLALFQDSGWYQVNFNAAQQMPWGRNAGCGFVTRRCIDSWPSNYLCTSFGQMGCTPDRLYRGSCTLTNHTSIPASQQYFPLPRAGGSDKPDYCPTFNRITGGTCTAAAEATVRSGTGDIVGPNSRCFAGAWVLAGYKLNSAATRGGCLQYACDAATGELLLTFAGTGGSKLTVRCPKAGGVIDVGAATNNQITGPLECPPATELCAPAVTVDKCAGVTCSGRGTCNATTGVCACSAGYYGSDSKSCDLVKCPGSPSECSGHGWCNAKTGQCETVAGGGGVAGCFAGYGGSDCSLLGCPTSLALCAPGTPAGACICSGRGACNSTSGACVCDPRYGGLDCSTLRCPGDCSGAGTCDTTTGLCLCADSGVSGTLAAAGGSNATDAGDDAGSGSAAASTPTPGASPASGSSSAQLGYYGGADCGAFVAGSYRPVASIPFLGETDGSTGSLNTSPLSLPLPQSAYVFARFQVDNADQSHALLVSLRNGSAPGAGIDASAVVFVGASYASPSGAYPSTFGATFAATPLRPDRSLLSLSFIPQRLTQGIQANPFTQAGIILVSLASNGPGLVASLNLTRDGCGDVECNYGTCTGQGVCVCDPGWSGRACDTPDCPGTPDCSGSRGKCVAQPVKKAAAQPRNATTGARLPGPVPYCSCDPLYAGSPDCSVLLPPASALLLGRRPASASALTTANASGFAAVSAVGNTTLLLATDGSGGGLIRGTLRGALDKGANVSVLIIEPATLRAAGFNPSLPASLVVRLNASAADGREWAAAGGGPDPILLAKLNKPPTLQDYDAFDVLAWRQSGQTQEFVLPLALGGDQPMFVSVFNGLYAQAKLAFTVTAEVAVGTCPPALNGCSGHGDCSATATCVCDGAFEGIRCDTPVVALSPPLANATVPSLAPGQWAYYVLDLGAASTAVAAAVTLRANAGASVRAAPVATAVFEPQRRVGSLSKLSSELALFDHAGYASGNGSLAFRVRRSSPATQRFLYVGVHNAVSGRGVFSGALTVSVSSTPLTPDCSGAVAGSGAEAACTASACNGHGKPTVINGAPGCVCDYGWAADADCASPLFSSFSQLVAAAQAMENLCSVCSDERAYLREGIQLFSIPQTVQKATTLRLNITAVAGSGRVLAGSSSSVSGVPSLLAAPRLPRSLLDFTRIASVAAAPSNASTTTTAASSRTGYMQTMLLDGGDTAASSYIVAVYANTAGAFRLVPSRSLSTLPPFIEPSFSEQFNRFVFHTKPGVAIFVVSIFLIIIMMSGCFLQCWERKGRDVSRRRGLAALRQLRRYRAQMDALAKSIEALGPQAFADTVAIRAYARRLALARKANGGSAIGVGRNVPARLVQMFSKSSLSSSALAVDGSGAAGAGAGGLKPTLSASGRALVGLETSPRIVFSPSKVAMVRDLSGRGVVLVPPVLQSHAALEAMAAADAKRAAPAPAQSVPQLTHTDSWGMPARKVHKQKVSAVTAFTSQLKKLRGRKLGGVLSNSEAWSTHSLDVSGRSVGGSGGGGGGGSQRPISGSVASVNPLLAAQAAAGTVDAYGVGSSVAAAPGLTVAGGSAAPASPPQAQQATVAVTAVAATGLQRRVLAATHTADDTWDAEVGSNLHSVFGSVPRLPVLASAQAAPSTRRVTQSTAVVRN